MSLILGRRVVISVFLSGLLAVVATAQPAPSSAQPAWVQRSNDDAKVLLDVMARYSPEAAAYFGVSGVDEQISDYTPGFEERMETGVGAAVVQLQDKLKTERDPKVRQDLQIMVRAGQDVIREQQLHRKYDMRYVNLSRIVFLGLRTLLDDQAPPARRAAALVRLRKYAGVEPGYKPISELVIAATRERNRRPGLLGPSKPEMEKDLVNSAFFIDGIGKLFQKFQLAGYEEPYASLKKQLEDYNGFVRADLLPKARTDFRLPPEEYAFLVEQAGVDIPPADLAAKAHAAFADFQRQMQVLAPHVAQQHGWKLTDYRDVIRELKKDQLVGDAILPHYQQRLRQIEDIIRREHLVTLPAREARIRIASAAESADTPAPNLHAPRLLGNTGEEAEFVLPLNIPAGPGAKEATKKFDDFTFAAASWTLTAHEARPGHELQFASVVEKGVSTARALFAFNSTNVEGWGLYAEAITFPYMPPDGQLISLQHRLMRAARAFLDPELQSGKYTPEQAKALLMNDVVLSDAMAQQEVERYMFWAPGQATSYFYGYTRLLQLRADTEKALGSAFDQQKFHDFVLAQGMVPPALLRTAVFEEFIPAQRKPAGGATQ